MICKNLMRTVLWMRCLIKNSRKNHSKETKDVSKNDYAFLQEKSF